MLVSLAVLALLGISIPAVWSLAELAYVCSFDDSLLLAELQNWLKSCRSFADYWVATAYRLVNDC